MVEVYFPGEKKEKLINRFDGSLTERYRDEEGRMIEDHHRAGEKSPLVRRDIYLDADLDATNRETIYFEGETGKEKPCLRQIFTKNRMRSEEGLRGSYDKLRYLEVYEYRGNESRPSRTEHIDYDENGKVLSKESQKSILQKASKKGINSMKVKEGR